MQRKYNLNQFQAKKLALGKYKSMIIFARINKSKEKVDFSKDNSQIKNDISLIFRFDFNDWVIFVIETEKKLWNKIIPWFIK